MIYDDHCEATVLALERGYYNPVLRNGHLVVYRDGVAIDYVETILYPRGLAAFGQTCTDWHEACRLLSLLPPARGVEPMRDSLHPEGF